MPSDHNLSPAAQDVRRHDRERFVTALFAPAEEREELMVLYAFNVEVARVRESVRESMAGMIRLQWWREVLSGMRDGEAARHPVAAPLLSVMRQKSLPLDSFERLLEAREADLNDQPPASLAQLENYAAGSSGVLTELAMRVLGIGDPASLDLAGKVGTGFALVGLVRAIPFHLSAGRLTLPADLLCAAGTSADEIRAGAASKRVIAEAARPVAQRGGALLAEARKQRVARAALPAVLPAVLASGHLRALERAGWDAFDGGVAMPRPMPVRLAINALLGRF